MAPLLLSIAILAVAISTPVSACNFHAKPSIPSFSNPHTGTVYKRAEGEIDFEYVNSFDWHTIKEGKTIFALPNRILTTPSSEYKLCHCGTSQSPIALHTNSGLATTRTPSFAGWAAHGPTTGTFTNWGFGPSYTIDHDPASTDFTTLPAMTFDHTTVYLTGWHLHFPSEHVVDGVRSRAEMHLVSVNAAGEPASVVSVRIQPTAARPAGSASMAARETTHGSPFFAQLPAGPMVGFNQTGEEVQGVVLDHTAVLAEVGGGSEYWTYSGSLTTPPCSEGLRWFVMSRVLEVSQEQMVALLEVGRFSTRVEQVVWNQAVNV